MRKRKCFNPEHSSTFAKALAKISVPEDYVGNPAFLSGIKKSKIVKVRKSCIRNLLWLTG